MRTAAPSQPPAFLKQSAAIKAAKGKAPAEAALMTANGVIETLDPDYHSKFKEHANLVVAAFAKLHQQEEALLRLKENRDIIPDSCRKDELKLEPKTSIKGSSEFLALDAKRAALLRDHQRAKKELVLELMALDTVQLRQDVLKALARAAASIANGFLAEHNELTASYTKHHSVADTMYCYGFGVLGALPFEVTPEDFKRAYQEAHGRSLPQPTQVAAPPTAPAASSTAASAGSSAPAESATPAVTPCKVFNPYAAEKRFDDASGRFTLKDVPAQSSPAYVTIKSPEKRRRLRSFGPFLDGLSQPDFFRAVPNDDYMCADEFYGLTPPSPIRPPPPAKRSRTDMESVASPSELVILEPTDGETEEQEEHKASTPPLTQTDLHDSEKEDDGDDAMGDKPSDGAAAPPQQPPDVKHFKWELGFARANTIDALSWLLMSGYIGSMNSYLDTFEARKKALRIKAAIRAEATEQLADETALKISSERPADRPVVESIVNEKMDKKMKANERRLQSLEAQVGNLKSGSSNKKQKTAASKNSSSIKNDNDKSAKKDRSGAAGAASTKKSGPPRRSSPRKPAGGRGGAGGSNGGAGRGSASNTRTRSTRSSNASKQPTKTKTSKRSGGSKTK